MMDLGVCIESKLNLDDLYKYLGFFDKLFGKIEEYRCAINSCGRSPRRGNRATVAADDAYYSRSEYRGTQSKAI